MAAVFTTIIAGTLGALVFANNVRRVNVVVNAKTYKVIKSGDYLKAAKMLSDLEKRARSFISTAAVEYPKDITIKRIQRYWTGTITEIPQSETIAYALDKKDLFMCVRCKDGNIQNIDDLMFVLLHELSHIMNSTFGHDDAFWKQFKKVLEMANVLGYLPFEDYDAKSVTVCGKVITSNPASCVFNGKCDSELTMRPIRPL